MSTEATLEQALDTMLEHGVEDLRALRRDNHSLFLDATRKLRELRATAGTQAHSAVVPAEEDELSQLSQLLGYTGPKRRSLGLAASISNMANSPVASSLFQLLAAVSPSWNKSIPVVPAMELTDEEPDAQPTARNKRVKTSATSAETPSTKPSSAAKLKTTIIKKSAAESKPLLAKPVARARDTEGEKITKETQAQPSLRARRRGRISRDLPESDSDDE